MSFGITSIGSYSTAVVAAAMQKRDENLRGKKKKELESPTSMRSYGSHGSKQPSQPTRYIGTRNSTADRKEGLDSNSWTTHEINKKSCRKRRAHKHYVQSFFGKKYKVSFLPEYASQKIATLSRGVYISIRKKGGSSEYLHGSQT